MDKFSLIDIKKINYADVYHFIYQNPGSPKQAIANQLNMSLPTVTQHLNTLLEDGLIEKSGKLSSNIGRKATAYTVLPNAHVAVGVEIVYDHITLTAVNLVGEIIAVAHAALTFEKNEHYYQIVSQHILNFIQELPLSAQQLLGIGFGFQGLVNSEENEVIYGKILDCTGLKTDIFTSCLNLDCPCRFFHDSECAALVDLWHNSDIQNAVYLSLGHHLGGAVILNGEIHKGRTGRTGTFEHMTLIPDGKECYCGKKGCMERYCSADALLLPGENLNDFFTAKEDGSEEHLARWEIYLNHLAAAINNIHMVIDIDVVLGGHMAPYLTSEDLQLLHEKVQEMTAFPEDEPFILQGNREKNAIAIGAALPFVQEYLMNIGEV